MNIFFLEFYFNVLSLGHQTSYEKKYMHGVVFIVDYRYKKEGDVEEGKFIGENI